MITGNVHDHLKGRRVRALVTQHRAWELGGDPHAGTVPIPEGTGGVITNVESHGSNPWTRYSVRFDNGTHASGLIMLSGTYHNDIELALGGGK